MTRSSCWRAATPSSPPRAWFGSTVSKGQTCIAVRRATVHRSLYPAFCEHLRGLAVKAEPMPLTLPAQAGKSISSWTRPSRAGAKLLVERPGADGACPPAVLIDATPEMAVCRGRRSASDGRPAVRRRGGGAWTWTGGAYALGRRSSPAVCRRPGGWPTDRRGTVAINDVVLPTATATPFSGSGASGWGSRKAAKGCSR
ncbi:MAG: hypothetical protein U0797_02720 [Gemmataceae bacterium]